MFRTIRALILAVVVAASLLGGASVASADTITVKVRPAPPVQIAADITWE